MDNAKPWSLDDFDYPLPPERIAHTAAEPRDSARLLLWGADGPADDTARTFADLPGLLNPGDVLVLNDTTVIPARLFGQRAARGQGAAIKVEVLLHRAQTPDLTVWQTFAKPGRRLRVGDTLTLDGGASVEILEKNLTTGQPVIRFNLAAAAIPAYLQTHGHTPLPPYINAADTPAVRARYQTVYANPAQAGSVAAPTAGLHFTAAVFQALKDKGVHVVTVTLQVGAGTFLNPTDEQLAHKRLHQEHASLSAAAAQTILAARAQGRDVIAVGTTALRTLESWARLSGQSPSGWSGETDLFLQPGDPIHVATRLITNFHLPRSSLLMLVAACIGYPQMQALYRHALAHDYRFFSFGDASLLTVYRP